MAQFTETGVELVVRGAGDFFGTLNKAGGKIAGFGKTVGKVAVAGMAAFGAAAAGVAAASVGAAISFESAWAGVIKTTDGLVDEMGNLTAAGEEVQQSFRDLAKEVPTSVEELLAIGELGGQLGIAQDSLVDFTRTIAAMGEATNLTTEEAATGFAQLANIMGTPQEQIENMGSSVVALGNNFATTERDILSFAQRIAGAGEIAGLTESQVFAIGAAMSSVGVQAEAGGTAVQKVLLAMNQAVLEGGDQLEIFAATAGFSADEFAAAWERDAGLAFQDFVEGLGAAGDDALAVLSALGLEDQRLIRSFLSLANAGDLLGETLDTSARAFRENTALTKEAEQRYRTTASQFKIFKNVIKDVGISIGSALLPFINDLLQAARPLIDEFAKQLPEFLNNNLIPAIREVATWLGEVLPIAIQFLSDFWTNMLQPALTQFWQFTTGTLIPLLSQLFTWLSQNIPVALQFLSDLWTGTLQPALQAVWAFIQSSVIPVLQVIGEWLSENLPVAIQFLSDTFAGFVAWFQANLPAMQATVETVLGAIRTFWETHGQAIIGFAQTAWETIKSSIEVIIGIIQSVISAVMAVIQGDWEGVWEAIRNIIELVWESIKNTINLALEALKVAIPIAWEAIKTVTTSAWEFIKEGISQAWESIKGIVKGALDVVRAVIQIGMDAAGRIFSNAWESIKSIFQTGKERVLGIVTGAIDAFKNAGRAIVEAIKEGVANAWDSFTSWFEDRLEGLTSWLPFSEPKNPASPLRGLSKAGEAIVGNIAAGMQAAIGQLEAAQIGLASAAQQSAMQTAAMPAAATAGASISVTNQFNTSINGGMSQAAFETQVHRVIERAIGQAA